MRYISTRGGDQLLSFEEVNLQAHDIDLPLNRNLTITDGPRRPCSEWWSLYPGVNSISPTKLAE